MRDLTDTEQARIEVLADFYASKGAHNGRGPLLTHADTADALGWYPHLVASTVRTIKEHPELNMSIAISRGPYPHVSFVRGQSAVAGGTVTAATQVDRDGFIEGACRIARYVGALRVSYNKVSDKRSTSAKRMHTELRRQVAGLRNLQSALDTTSVREERVAEFIDSVLGGV